MTRHKRPPAMTPALLRAWRARQGWSQPKAAAALDLSLRGYQQYELGERPIRGHIMLACIALAFGFGNHADRARAFGRDDSPDDDKT